MGGKEMINTKSLIYTIAIIFIILSLFAGLYVSAEINNIGSKTNDLQARKDDLIAKQLELETLIKGLNNTLQAELSREKNLSIQLSSITGINYNNASIFSQNQQSSQSPSPPVPQPTQAPTPIVTRAS
jgi:hypothetical protein